MDFFAATHYDPGAFNISSQDFKVNALRINIANSSWYMRWVSILEVLLTLVFWHCNSKCTNNVSIPYLTSIARVVTLNTICKVADMLMSRFLRRYTGLLLFFLLEQFLVLLGVILYAAVTSVFLHQMRITADSGIVGSARQKINYMAILAFLIAASVILPYGIDPIPSMVYNFMIVVFAVDTVIQLLVLFYMLLLRNAYHVDGTDVIDMEVRRGLQWMTCGIVISSLFMVNSYVESFRRWQFAWSGELGKHVPEYFSMTYRFNTEPWRFSDTYNEEYCYQAVKYQFVFPCIFYICALAFFPGYRSCFGCQANCRVASTFTKPGFQNRNAPVPAYPPPSYQDCMAPGGPAPTTSQAASQPGAFTGGNPPSGNPPSGNPSSGNPFSGNIPNGNFTGGNIPGENLPTAHIPAENVPAQSSVIVTRCDAPRATAYSASGAPVDVNAPPEYQETPSSPPSYPVLNPSTLHELPMANQHQYFASIYPILPGPSNPSASCSTSDSAPEYTEAAELPEKKPL